MREVRGSGFGFRVSGYGVRVAGNGLRGAGCEILRLFFIKSELCFRRIHVHSCNAEVRREAESRRESGCIRFISQEELVRELGNTCLVEK